MEPLITTHTAEGKDGHIAVHVPMNSTEFTEEIFAYRIFRSIYPGLETTIDISGNAAVHRYYMPLEEYDASVLTHINNIVPAMYYNALLGWITLCGMERDTVLFHSDLKTDFISFDRMKPMMMNRRSARSGQVSEILIQPNTELVSLRGKMMHHFRPMGVICGSDEVLEAVVTNQLITKRNLMEYSI